MKIAELAPRRAALVPAAVPDGASSAADILALEDLARRLRVSPKTLKRWGREAGLPLFRLTPGGPLYARWAHVDAWITRRAIPQTGGHGQHS